MYITIHLSKNVNSVQIFFASTPAKFHVQTSVWTESFKQLHRHYFMLELDQIPLNFLLNFPFISYHSHIYRVFHDLRTLLQQVIS